MHVSLAAVPRFLPRQGGSSALLKPKLRIQASTLCGQLNGKLPSAVAKFALGILVLTPLILLVPLAAIVWHRSRSTRMMTSVKEQLTVFGKVRRNMSELFQPL